MTFDHSFFRISCDHIQFSLLFYISFTFTLFSLNISIILSNTPCFRIFAQNSRQRLQLFSRQRHLQTFNWYYLTLRYKRALNPEKLSNAFNRHTVCSISWTPPSAIYWTLDSTNTCIPKLLQFEDFWFWNEICQL